MAENNLEILNLEIKVSADEALAKISEVKSGLRGLNNIKVDAKIDTVAKQAEESAQSAESSAKRIKTAMEDAASSVDKGARKARSSAKKAFEEVDLDISSISPDINIDSSGLTTEAKEEGKKVGEAFEDGVKYSLNDISKAIIQLDMNVGSLTEAQKKKESEAVKIDPQKAFDNFVDPKVYANLGKIQETLKSMAGIDVSKPFKKLAVAITVAKKAIELVKKAVDAIKKQLSELMSIAKKISKFFAKLEPFHGWEKKLASLIGTLQRQVLRKAINYMLTSISQGFTSGLENLEAYDARFKATMQSLRSSLGLFQNSLVVAVAPIINYVAPALNKLMSMLTAACNQIARLTALLTGQKTYTIAKGYEDIADSAGSATDAAKELEATILGFDEINKLNGDSGSSSGSGSGTSDGISTYETVDVGDWQYKSWGEAFLAFVDWLNSTGVPKLNSALSNAAKTFNDFNRNIGEMLSFDGVQDAIAELGANIGTALNDFVNHGIDWKLWGQAFGLSIQTGLNFAANMFRSFNFNELGTNLAEWVNSAINEINPKDLATMLMSKITAGIRLVTSFLSSEHLGDWGTWAAQVVNNMVSELSNAWATVTPESIRTNVSDFFTNLFDGIDWDDVFDTLSDIADDLSETLGGILSDVQSNESFQNAVYEFAKFAAKLAFDWWKTKAFAKFGTIGSIISGGLNDTEDNASVFSGGNEMVRQDILADASGEVSQYTSTTSAAIELWRNTFSNAFSSVGEANSNLAETSAENASSISTIFSELGTNVSTSTAEASQTMTTGWQTLSTSVGTTVEGLKTTIGQKFSNIKTTMGTLMSQAGTSITTTMSTLKSKLTTIASGIGSGLSSAWNTIKSTAVNTFTQMSQSVHNIFSGLWNGIKSVINGLISGVETMANAIIGGVNGAIRSINSLHFTIPKWVPGFGGKSIGFNIAQLGGVALPRLATGGIVENPTQAIIGENGREAVLPLERNTGWMDVLASRISSSISLNNTGNDQPIVCQVYLDTNQIATAVTRGQNRQNRRYSSVSLV